MNLINYFEKKYKKKIKNFSKKIWGEISKSNKPYLTEDFIEEFETKLSWYWICSFQKLSEDFIEKFENKVDWFWISTIQKLSDEFIMKNIDKIDIDGLVLNKKIKLSDSCKLLLIIKYPEHKEEILRL